ncbi:MAG: hypothetical protein RSD52_06520 [Oscillospiraceae bacterium]
MQNAIQTNTSNIAFNVWFDACMENAEKNDASSVHCYEFEGRICLVTASTNLDSNTTLDTYLKRVLADGTQDI